jgi:hypothetical protein
MALINRLVRIFGLFILLSVTGAHHAVIQNHCEFPIWVTSVAPRPEREIAPVQKMIRPNDQYREPYQIYGKGSGGQSLKIRRRPELYGPCGQTPITQFEYTIDDKIWFDISNVNCAGDNCPIARRGLFLTTTNPRCQIAYCGPGEVICPGAYLWPTDDTKTRSCYDLGAETTLHLCTDRVPNFRPPSPCGHHRRNCTMDCTVDQL